MSAIGRPGVSQVRTASLGAVYGATAASRASDVVRAVVFSQPGICQSSFFNYHLQTSLIDGDVSEPSSAIIWTCVATLTPFSLV